MTEENGAIRFILALAFLNAAICNPIPSKSSPTMQIMNTTLQLPPNNFTVYNSTKRDQKHEPLDQLAQEQRLALQIITTDSVDSGISSGGNEGNNNLSPSARAKQNREERSYESNNHQSNGAISFDDQFNHMEAQLKRSRELSGARGEKLKRIVINLDSLMSNGSNLPHEKGTKLTIGFSPVASDPLKQNLNFRQQQQPSQEEPKEANNDKGSGKNSLVKSTSKKKEISSLSPDLKKARSQGASGANGEAQPGGSRTTMRGAIREAVRKQGGIPTMVMSEIEFGSGGVGGEPRIKFMVNSEAVDLMHRQGPNNVQDIARPLQSSESAINDVSLQEAIDTLSGEIESLERQLESGVDERSLTQQRDHFVGNIVADASTSSANSRQQLVRQRDPRHLLPAPLPTPTETPSADGIGYYTGPATNLGTRSGRTSAVRDDGQATVEDGNENYETSGQRIRADNNQDENDDDDSGENRERSNESDSSGDLVDKSTNSMSRDSHANRHQSNSGSEENSDNGNNHNSNNNNDNNNDDSAQNYETRAASDKLSGEKLELMNNPDSTHRLHAASTGEGFTVSSKPLLVDNSNLFNEQIEPTAQQVDYYENKSNDMSANVAVPDGSAPNPATNDSSLATKKLATKQKRQQPKQMQQPPPPPPTTTTTTTTTTTNIESENKMEERVAQILDRLKLYTTKDQLMKVARDLQNNYPNSGRDSADGLKNAADLHGDLGAINRSGQQVQSPHFAKRNHPITLMDSLRSSPWPMREMLDRAGLTGEEDSIEMEMEMARKHNPLASLHGTNDNAMDSLLTSATNSQSGGEAEARVAPSQSSGLRNNDGSRFGSSIEERKRMLENGIKLLNEFRTRQMKLKSMEDSASNRNAESVEPASDDQQQQQQGNIARKQDNRGDGNGVGYDSESARQDRLQNSAGPNKEDEEPESSYEVTNMRQQVNIEPLGSVKEYETTKDLADTMENNEKNFEDENHQRADGSRKNRRYIVDGHENNSLQNGIFNDGVSEASETSQQESIGNMDDKNDSIRREGEAELKALEQIIDELMRRERKDKRKRDLNNQ